MSKISEVHVDIQKDYYFGKIYFIYVYDGSAKLWVTKDFTLNRYKNLRAYAKDWKKVAEISSKIFSGEIK